MWYVYKCICSTRSRTRSSFTRPMRGQSRYTYTYRHYNSVITANHSYTEEQVSGKVTRCTVIMVVSLYYTYIGFSRRTETFSFLLFFSLIDNALYGTHQSYTTNFSVKKNLYSLVKSKYRHNVELPCNNQPFFPFVVAVKCRDKQTKEIIFFIKIST